MVGRGAASGTSSITPEGDTFTMETATRPVDVGISAGPTNIGGSRRSSRLSTISSIGQQYHSAINER